MVLEARNSHDRTALLIAVHGKNYELMDLLIRAGADLEARDDNYDAIQDIALNRRSFPLAPRHLCPAVYQVLYPF